MYPVIHIQNKSHTQIDCVLPGSSMYGIIWDGEQPYIAARSGKARGKNNARLYQR